MGRIQEYTSPIDKLTPTSMGSEAFEIEGRHVGAAFNQLGHEIGGAVDTYVDHENQQDIAALSNAASQNFIANTASWNKTISSQDPSQVDPAETQQKWLSEQFEPSLDKLSGMAKTDAGRKWVDRFANEQRMHFAERTTADMSTMSGLAVQSNINQSLNNYSQAARLDGTPGGLGAILRMSDASIEANIDAHNLTGDKAAQIRESYMTAGRREISRASAMGAAERNPVQFKADLAAGKYADYFSGEDAASLDKYADSQTRASIEATKAQGEVQRKQEDEQFGGAMTKLYSQQIDPHSGKLAISPDFFKSLLMYAQMPGAERHVSELKSMGDWAQAEVKRAAAGTDVVSDPHIVDDFRERALLPQTDPHALSPSQIFSARAQGQLSEKDFQFYKGYAETMAKDPQKTFAERRFNDFLASEKPSFIPKQGAFSLTGGNPKDNQRWYAYQTQARAAFESAYSKGNWQEALDPKSGSFIGKTVGAAHVLQKGTNPVANDPNGAVVNGKKFVGHTKEDWSNPKMWVGQ